MAKLKKINVTDLITLFIVIITVAINIYAFKNKLIRLFNDFFYGNIEITTLTEKQKIEDFDYLYNRITNGIPQSSLNEFEQLYGINFKDNYDKYKELIIKTKSDAEYYCAMKEIMADLPSFHTDIVFPRYSVYETLDCFNSNNVLNTKYIKQKSEYWNNVLSNECNDYSSIRDGSDRFIYINGSYVNETTGYSLIEIDNYDANEFILNQMSTINLKYDYINKQAYRESFIVHKTPRDNSSDKIKYKVLNKDGSISEQIGYLDSVLEWVYRYGHNFDKDYHFETYVTDNAVYNFDDNENEVCYLMLDTMYGDCAMVPEIVSGSLYDTVILDIRNNTGGYEYGVAKYVYSPLFAENIVQNKEWYFPDVFDTKQILWLENFESRPRTKFTNYNNSNQMLNTFDKSYITAQKTLKFNGAATSNKKVYLLVSDGTGSAADGFAALLKDNNLATLIGSNTGGEGLADSFIVDSLPNSGLVFIFTYSIAFGCDGLNNSVYGTSPDVYVNISVDGFNKSFEIKKSGQDPYTYKNRLKWDDVLIKTLEIIKEEEEK